MDMFGPEIAPLDPLSPKTTLEPNMKWIGSPVAEIWPFVYVGGILNPHLGGGRGGRRGSAIAPL